MLTRRSFIGSILAFSAAPVIVRADSLMRIVPRNALVLGLDDVPDPSVAFLRFFSGKEGDPDSRLLAQIPLNGEFGHGMFQSLGGSERTFQFARATLVARGVEVAAEFNYKTIVTGSHLRVTVNPPSLFAPSLPPSRRSRS